MVRSAKPTFQPNLAEQLEVRRGDRRWRIDSQQRDMRSKNIGNPRRHQQNGATPDNLSTT